METTNKKIQRWCNTILKSEWIKKNGEPKVLLLEVLNLTSKMDREKVYAVKSDSCHSVNYTKYNNICDLCNLLEIDLITGNDAPRGNKLNDYLLVGDKDAYAWNSFMYELKIDEHYNVSKIIEMGKLKEVLNKYKEI